MFSLLRRQCASRPCLHSLPRPVLNAQTPAWRKGLATVVDHDGPSDVDKETKEAEHDEVDLPDSSEGTEAHSEVKSFAGFMQTIGSRYEYAAPKQWLGNQLPFPMNPSFKPPPPLTGQQREIIWKLYQQSPTQKNIRKISKMMNISLKRVSAILRLQRLEAQWIANKPLQTGFEAGMEYLLEATQHPKARALYNEFVEKGSTSSHLSLLEEHSDRHQADILEEVENRDSSKLEYERLYWESIPEHHLEPTMPTLLHHAKQTAELKALAENTKRNARFVTKVRQTPFIRRPKQPIITLRREDKAPIQFIDVGARYIDPKEQSRRMAMASRRASIKVAKKVQLAN